MKRTVGLVALMLTAMTAFAQPAAAMVRREYRRPVVERGRVVVVHRDVRVRDLRRDPYCR